MAAYLSTDNKKVTAKRFFEFKERNEKISMLTAYDYTTARIIDAGGVDCILIGDSASNVMAGNIDTLPITVDQMIYHARSVARGVSRAWFCAICLLVAIRLSRRCRTKCSTHYEREWGRRIKT